MTFRIIRFTKGQNASDFMFHEKMPDSNSRFVIFEMREYSTHECSCLNLNHLDMRREIQSLLKFDFHCFLFARRLTYGVLSNFQSNQ